MLGGSIIGLLVFLFPPLFGEGYEFINNLISGNSNHILDNSPFFNPENQVATILLFLIGLPILFSPYMEPNASSTCYAVKSA